MSAYVNFSMPWFSITYDECMYSRMYQIKFCQRPTLKTWSNMVCSNRLYNFKFFKGYFTQILLGPLLNTGSRDRALWLDKHVKHYQVCMNSVWNFFPRRFLLRDFDPLPSSSIMYDILMSLLVILSKNAIYPLLYLETYWLHCLFV